MDEPTSDEERSKLRGAMRHGIVLGALVGALGSTSLHLLFSGRWGWGLLVGGVTCVPGFIVLLLALPDDFDA